MQRPGGPPCFPYLQSPPASQVLVPAASSIRGTLFQTLGPRWQKLPRCWGALKERKALYLSSPDKSLHHEPFWHTARTSNWEQKVLIEIWESAEIPSYTNLKSLTFKTGSKGPISCQQKGNSAGIMRVSQSKLRDGGSRGKTLLMSSWIPTGDCFGFQFNRSRDWMIF